MSASPLRLRELLQRLVEAGISFILVGGLAVNAWGYLRGTQDVDVVPDPDPENLAKLDEHWKPPRNQAGSGLDGGRRYPFATSFPGRVAGRDA